MQAKGRSPGTPGYDTREGDTMPDDYYVFPGPPPDGYLANFGRKHGWLVMLWKPMPCTPAGDKIAGPFTSYDKAKAVCDALNLPEPAPGDPPKPPGSLTAPDGTTLSPGQRIIVNDTISPTTAAWFIKPECLARREPGVAAILGNWVPGHGGDVWWAQHGDGTVAPYMTTEFTVV